MHFNYYYCYYYDYYCDCYYYDYCYYLFPGLRQQLFCSPAGPYPAGQLHTGPHYQVALPRIRLLHQVEEGMGEGVPAGSIPVLLDHGQKDWQHLCTAFTVSSMLHIGEQVVC